MHHPPERLGGAYASELAGRTQVVLRFSPVHLTCVTLSAALIVIGLRVARHHLQISRDSTATSTRRERPRNGASSSPRAPAFLHPFADAPSVQFASEAQPLFTSYTRKDSTGGGAESWPGEGPSLIASLLNRSRRARFVQDTGILATIHSDSSSLAEQDDHGTSVGRQNVGCDEAKSSDGSDNVPQTIHIQEIPARIDGGSIMGTETDSTHSDADLMITDTDSHGSRVIVCTVPEFLLPDQDSNTQSVGDILSALLLISEDGKIDSPASADDDHVSINGGDLDMAVNEMEVLSHTHSVIEGDDVLSGTRSVHGDSDIDSLTMDDGYVSGGIFLHDGMEVNEGDDVHSVIEDDVLSDAHSVSGLSDTSSWVTTDDSAADYSSPDVESDASAWITTDDEDSDWDSPSIANDELVLDDSDAHSFVYSDSIFDENEDSLLHSAASSPRDNARPARLDSPTLSELADEIRAHLGYVPQSAVPGFGMYTISRRTALIASSSSLLSVSDRDWSPAAPGFVFSIGSVAPSTSSPALSISSPASSPSRVLHARSSSDGQALRWTSQDLRSFDTCQNSRPVSPAIGHAPFVPCCTDSAHPWSSSPSFRECLVRLAESLPDELVGSVAAMREGSSFASHQRLVTV